MRKLSTTTVFTAVISVFLLLNSAASFAAKQSGPIEKYQGQWVIISYWADWCHYCMREMPELNRFQKKHRKNAVVIGVNYDALPMSALNKFAKKHNYEFKMMSTFPIYKYSSTRINSIPMTFVFNPTGKLVSVLHGAQTEHSLSRITGLT